MRILILAWKSREKGQRQNGACEVQERKPMNTVHGVARLDGDRLTITTSAKRGKKMVPNVQTYLVENLCPDERVANPAWKLTKGVFVKAACDMSAAALESGADEEFKPSGEVWTVSVGEYGPECSCPHATFRTNGAQCKHIGSAIAVGLIPREPIYPGAKDDGNDQAKTQEDYQPDATGAG